MRMTICLIFLTIATAVQAAQVERPDLIVSGAGLTSAGQVTFVITNHGEADINTPFKVDAWLDGYLRKTIQFAAGHSVGAIVRNLFPTTLPFGRGEQRHFTLGDVKVDSCSSTHTVKVIADSGNAISELSESNNEMSWTGPTPCPDLAIKSISKHWQNGMHTEFTAEVVIINQGTGDAGPFAVAAGAFTQSGLGIPSGAPTMYEGLRAGQTMTIHTGNAYVPDGLTVHVVVDAGNIIKESNENNNVADKTLH
jgi:subtilase family serine protease